MNILITGTPGTGKTSLAKQVALNANLKHIDVSALIKQHELHAGFNNNWHSLEFDDEAEDALMDLLEDILKHGGCVVDTHSPSSFPIRWFNIVVCLACKTEVLYDRLSARGYSPHKLSENIQCEIQQVCLEDVSDFENVEVLQSNTKEEQLTNVKKIVELLQLNSR
jgi:adenylate kinase